MVLTEPVSAASPSFFIAQHPRGSKRVRIEASRSLEALLRSCVTLFLQLVSKQVTSPYQLQKVGGEEKQNFNALYLPMNEMTYTSMLFIGFCLQTCPSAGKQP